MKIGGVRMGGFLRKILQLKWGVLVVIGYAVG
jgi:hypothetical protein